MFLTLSEKLKPFSQLIEMLRQYKKLKDNLYATNVSVRFMCQTKHLGGLSDP